MSFFDELDRATRAEQDDLFDIPLVRALVDGPTTLDDYTRFLAQAYHHVKHTVPLLMTAGGAMPDDYAWARQSIAHYIAEELGHEEWILADLAQCGVDPATVRHAPPSPACELMIAYAYDVIHRRHPIGFFGMVHVLEGASVRGATRAAHGLQRRLSLPETAFTYLSTHGDLDQDHIQFLRTLIDRIEQPAEQALVIHTSRMFSRLYGDVFRSAAPVAFLTAAEAL